MVIGFWCHFRLIYVIKVICTYYTYKTGAQHISSLLFYMNTLFQVFCKCWKCVVIRTHNGELDETNLCWGCGQFFDSFLHHLERSAWHSILPSWLEQFCHFCGRNSDKSSNENLDIDLLAILTKWYLLAFSLSLSLLSHIIKLKKIEIVFVKFSIL